MKTRSVFLLFCVGFLLRAPCLDAQTIGATIRGRITDKAGLPGAKAQVTLRNEETNERRQATAGPQGDFALLVLPPGTYQLEVESPGFKKHLRKGFVLLLDQSVILDVVLEVGLPGEEVLVFATQPLIRKDSASLGLAFENSQIVSLPLDGRNFLELSLLVPGTAPSAPGSPGSVRGEFSVNVNGGREDANNFLLDGVHNGDPKLNTFALNPPVDGIREFEILTGAYDASFGRSASAQINVAMKSGTNAYHGTVYEFFRNASLDARNFFSRAEDGRPKYQRNQYGFSFGGPFCKNRTFFFADYEGRRLREGITQVTNVPDARERLGDFSRSARPAPLDFFTQQPFPGGVIPSLRQSKVGQAIANLYPLPNRPVTGANFVSSPALRDRDDRFDVRLDHALRPSSDLVFRYSFSDRDLYEPFPGSSFSLVPGYGNQVPRRAQNLMMGENHFFSPSLINEARVAYTRVAIGVFQEGLGRSLNRQVGMPELSANSRDFGLSFITITGISPLGHEYNSPQQSATNNLQVLDNVTYARGPHILKIGFDFRNLQQNAFRDVQARGFLTFIDRGQLSGNALADLLLGYPYLTGGAKLDNPQHLRTRSYNYYVQDSYRIRPNLTLQFGARYEFNAPPVDRYDRANIYDPSTGTLVSVGKNGIPRSGYNADRNNWAPRFGLAWSPFGGDRTVVHAGYGLYYDQSSLAPGEGLYFNNPYFNLNLFFSLPGLPVTVDNPFPSFFPYPLPGSALGFQRDLRTAYFQHWNLNLQHQFGASRVAEVAYAGAKGTHILAARDLNQPAASARTPNLRPNVYYDDITFEESRGVSTYHSLQTRIQQRLQNGMGFLGSYTWAKSLDDTSTFFASAGDANFPQDSRNLRAERGRSNFDLRHRFSFAFSADLPLGRDRRLLANNGWLSTLLGGWRSEGIVTLQSGRPFTVALLSDIDNSNTGRSTLGFGANDRPNRVSSGVLSDPNPEKWFDTAAFKYSPFGTFGNSGRNILDGPGYADTSIGFLKDSKIGESLKLQFRAEFFNTWNRANFNLPDKFVDSPTFGKILSAQSPRRVQFGVKLIF